jgi:thiamine kinase-like enzyme
MLDQVELLMARLWPDRALHAVALPGGITNANFMVDLGDQRVVVRIAGENTRLLGIDRRQEIAANRLAASIGIAPEVLDESPDEGWTVTRFLDGRTVSPAELASEPLLGEVASTLRQIHSAGVIEMHFNPFSIVSNYHEIAVARGVSEPFDYLGANTVLGRIVAVRPFRPLVFCHNDLLNGNFLYDERLRVLDWEYAGMGDPFFDLANFSVNHALASTSDQALLLHYLGYCDAGPLAVLDLMKLVSELREAMWGVVQCAVSTLEFDFVAYAEERGGRFASLLGSMDVEDLLVRAALVST